MKRSPQPHRYRRAERLCRTESFRRVYEKGKRRKNHLFIAFLFESSSGLFRVGVVASRRVGGAVQRNRAKRLLREAFRKKRLGVPLSADLVLVARKPIVTASIRAVEAEYVRTITSFVEN